MIVSTLDPATWISVRTENLIESSPRVKIVKNSSGFIQHQPSEPGAGAAISAVFTSSVLHIILCVL